MEDSLGKLVEFNQQRRTAPKQAGSSGSAQIIFFTGVRYERGPIQPAPARFDPTRPTRKRG